MPNSSAQRLSPPLHLAQADGLQLYAHCWALCKGRGSENARQKAFQNRHRRRGGGSSRRLFSWTIQFICNTKEVKIYTQITKKLKCGTSWDSLKIPWSTHKKRLWMLKTLMQSSVTIRRDSLKLSSRNPNVRCCLQALSKCRPNLWGFRRLITFISQQHATVYFSL